MNHAGGSGGPHGGGLRRAHWIVVGVLVLRLALLGGALLYLPPVLALLDKPRRLAGQAAADAGGHTAAARFQATDQHPPARQRQRPEVPAGWAAVADDDRGLHRSLEGPGHAPLVTARPLGGDPGTRERQDRPGVRDGRTVAGAGHS